MSEIRRRHVARVAFAYAAAAVVTLEALELIIPAFDLPDRLLQLLVVAAVLGFPVAVVLAWVYDVTPEGLRRTEETDGPGRDGGPLAAVALLVVTVLSVGFVGWWVVRHSIAADPHTVSGQPSFTAVPVSEEARGPIRSIAVLPLDDFSEGGTEEYFAASMHEALITELSQIPELRVVSRTTVMGYAESTQSLPEIAQALSVEGVIEGSVVRAGDQVRITVQLIHGPTDEHRWAENYQGDLSDVLGLQARVAREIATEIQAQLEPAPVARTASRTVNPEAQEAYLRGRYEQSKGTPDGLRSAIQHFETATRIDSQFAPAFTQLAGANVLVAMTDTVGAESALVEAEGAIERALALDPESPEAQAVLSTLSSAMARHSELEREIRITVTALSDSMGLDADWVAAATEFGHRMARLDIGLMPPPPAGEAPVSHSELGKMRQVRALTASGEYDQAMEVVEGVLDDNPASPLAWDALRTLYLTVRDFDGAAELEQRRAELMHDEAAVARAEALENAVDERGPQEYWRWLLQDISEARAAGRSPSPVDAAMAHAQLGETDRAFQELADALNRRDPRLFSLQSSPIWDPLRTDPRFKDVVSALRDPSRFRAPSTGTSR